MAKIKRVGHVVLGVHDTARSVEFYTKVLGMELVCGIEEMGMSFFSFGERDHDLAVMQVPAEVPIASPGLAHVALEIDGGVDELRELYERLKGAGVAVEFTVDHIVTKSVYFPDPDGNRLELFTQAMAAPDAIEYLRSIRSVEEAMQPLDLETAGV